MPPPLRVLTEIPARRARAQAILAAYPLHYYEELVPLQQKWLVFSLSPWRTPVDSIKDYFGEKVRAHARWRFRRTLTIGTHAHRLGCTSSSFRITARGCFRRASRAFSCG